MTGGSEVGTLARRMSRRFAGRATLALVAAVLLAAATPPRVAAPAVAGAAQDSTPRHRVYSVKDTPGYRPLADPESSSVRIGRRLNAPLVSKPFKGGAGSLRELTLAICRSLHTVNRDSLLGLCITDDEFRDILWREFPQSRPATGIQWDDAWKILYARLHAGCMHALRDEGGHLYELQSVRADSVAHYRNFTLHSRVTIVVKDDLGQVQTWRWLRGIAERKGRFKIYSTED
jgi:hypothetical protein